MSLFETAVAQVMKDVGNETLLPVPDRSSSDYCKILSLVQRETSPWHLPWNSSERYITTELDLNDLLMEPIDVTKLVTSTVLFENYESTPSFHKNGKIGVKIAEEFDVDVSVIDTMKGSLKLGNVMKKEIPWQVLYDTINNKKVNMDHPLVKVVNKSKSLFVIHMVVTSGSDELISLDHEMQVDAAASANLEVQVALHLSISGLSDNKQHKQYAIPLGTSFGYCCFQIKIDKNGVLNLQLGEDVVDGTNGK